MSTWRSGATYSQLTDATKYSPLSTLFTPAVPEQAVAVLLLIENSRSVSSCWSDLRDHYLTPLLEKLETANPGTPVITLVIQDGSPSVVSQHKRWREGLAGVKFDPTTDYIEKPFSLKTITQAIDRLGDTHHHGQPACRHLFLVAGLAPCLSLSCTDDVPVIAQTVAQTISRAGIYLHLVLRPSSNTAWFMSVFDESLRLENNIEQMSGIPVDPQFAVIRLSARPPRSSTASEPWDLVTSCKEVPPTISLDPPLSDHGPTADSFDSFQPPTHLDLVVAADGPTIVERLQQAHGLTKKKAYGAKPVRKSFFRDEPFRGGSSRGKSMLPPLEVAPGSQHISRSRSHSVADGTTYLRRRHDDSTRIVRASTLPTNDPSSSPSSTASSEFYSSPSSPASPRSVLELTYPKTVCDVAEPVTLSDPWAQGPSFPVTPMMSTVTSTAPISPPYSYPDIPGGTLANPSSDALPRSTPSISYPSFPYQTGSASVGEQYAEQTHEAFGLRTLGHQAEAALGLTIGGAVPIAALYPPVQQAHDLSTGNLTPAANVAPYGSGTMTLDLKPSSLRPSRSPKIAAYPTATCPQPNIVRAATYPRPAHSSSSLGASYHLSTSTSFTGNTVHRRPSPGSSQPYSHQMMPPTTFTCASSSSSLIGWAG